MNNRLVFCRNVQKIMENNNISIKEMAEIMEVKEAAVKQLCENTIPTDLYVDALFNLCFHFNLTPSDLL